MDAWTDSLRLLKLDLTSLAWPLLSGELKAKTKLRCPDATCFDALAKSLSGLNFLERHSVSKAVSKIIDDKQRWRWRLIKSESEDSSNCSHYLLHRQMLILGG
jgi:hypothetical protein